MAPRFRRLASTISRDDIIAVIGASSASLPAFSDGAVVRFGFWFMANLCQQTSPMPRLPKSLTMSSICHALGQTNKTATAPKPPLEDGALSVDQRDDYLSYARVGSPTANPPHITERGPPHQTCEHPRQTC